MVAVAAGVACSGVTCGVGEAVGDSLADHFRHQRVQTEGGRDQKSDARMSAGRLGGQPRDVFVPMPPGQQKIREHDHYLGPALDAAGESRRD